MKNWKILIVGLIVFIDFGFAEPKEIDKVAAVVNNGIILESDINNLLKLIQIRQQKIGLPPLDKHFLRQQIMNKLIIDSMQLQMVKRMGISLSNTDLDNEIVNIASQNKMNLSQLKNRLSYEGLDYDTYRTQVQKEMLIAAVRNASVGSRVTILPEEIKEVEKRIVNRNGNNTEIKISHIFIPFPVNPSQRQIRTTETLAKKIMGKLKNGADFGKLAVTYSNDPNSLKGGSMGWQMLEQIPALFYKHLVSKKKGVVIPPIRSEVGFHILKVNDIRHAIGSVSETAIVARHILLKPSGKMTDNKARSKLISVTKDIKIGRTTFSDAAKQLSQDTSSALKGGNIGLASSYVYDPAFRDALRKLKKNEISEPVKSRFGWHLIQLIDTHHIEKINTIKKNIASQILFKRKFYEETKIWINELRSRTYLKIFNGDA